MADIKDIEWGFEYVSSQPKFSCRVIYDKKNECIYSESDMSGESDIPEDLDWDHCIEIPHKNDLDLGVHLVLEFAAEKLPVHYDRVMSFFRKPGAYARFKDLLEREDMLQAWYEYEQAAQERALKQWCKENGITI
jgi:hypothetical protein